MYCIWKSYRQQLSILLHVHACVLLLCHSDYGLATVIVRFPSSVKDPVPCREDTKRKINLPSVEKRYAPVVYSLCTYFIRFTHQVSVHCDFIRLKCVELHAVYDFNLQHTRATNGPCPLSFVKRLRCPFCFLLAS